MRTKKITNQALIEFIITKNVVLMVELKDFLQTNVNMTVYRRLQELSYISSCSHRGKYYSSILFSPISKLAKTFCNLDKP